MNETTPFDPLRVLLEQVRAKADLAYLDAVALGVEGPTILVLDLRDELARDLLIRYGAASEVEAFLARSCPPVRRPHVAFALTRAEAVGLLAADAGPLAADLASAPAAEGYLAVVVAYGKGMVAEVCPPYGPGASLIDPSRN